MKEISPRSVRRTLSKYDLVQWEIEVGQGHELRLVGVTDPYQLLDRMLENEAEQATVRFPYWAEVWPSSIALGGWFLDRAVTESPDPLTAVGKGGGDRVLELGCGLGLLGICLARAGWHVQATDFVEDALIFTSHNAATNGVSGRHQVGYLDWRRPVGSPVPCIIGADLVYEKSNHAPLDKLLRQLLLPGGCFILSDPRRPMARHFCRLLEDQGYGHTAETREVR